MSNYQHIFTIIFPLSSVHFRTKFVVRFVQFCMADLRQKIKKPLLNCITKWLIVLQKPIYL
jgi:hypothetical protein